MIGRIIGIFIAVFLTLPAVSFGADELSYSGSSTIGQAILNAGAAKAFEAKTKIKLNVDNPGSGKGIKALLEGKVDVAGASRSLEPSEKQQKLIGTTIGYDGIAVFVHKSNPVKNLTKEQIKGIFTGRITNWKEVGGKNAAIKPNTEIQGGKRATIEVFQEMVMDKAPFAKGFKEIDMPKDQIIETSKDENSICGVSLGLLAAVPPDVKAKVKAISVNGIEPTNANIQSGAYIISRPLLLVSKGLPKGNVKTFIDFMLSKEGQSFVEANFVPVKK